MNNKQQITPAAHSKHERPAIALHPVSSSQVKAVGYDAQSKTLAVQFTRGTGAIYHYPNVEAKTHSDFIGADSVGTYFGKHIKHLPFEKFHPDKPKAS